jgi:uncharacterized protein
LNAYLDTSALVKLYVREPGSRDVARVVAEAGLAATSRVAYPEARAAFARRKREGAFRAAALRRIVGDLDRDLAHYVVVELTAELASTAGELAERHALRGFDAIHLASALWLRESAGDFGAFAAYDARLVAAATAEGFAVVV